MSSSVDAAARTDEAGQGEERELIDLSSVTGLRGELGERATQVDIALEDGRVLTATVEQVHTGEHQCPSEGCIRRFETEKGLRIHLGHRHSEEGDRVCPECGDTFHTPPSVSNEYCSWDCYKADRTATTVCEMCGGEFEHKTSREPSYCSNPCRYEGRRTSPRPDDVHDLLHELYIEENKDRETTIERALANLGVDSGWTERSLREELMGEIAADPLDDIDVPDHVTPTRVRAAVNEATTLLEVQRNLRISRDRTRRVLSRLDLTDEIGDDEAVVEAARKKIGLDEDGNSVDTPEGETGWTQFSGRGGDEA